MMITFVSKDKGSTGRVWCGRRWCFQVKWLIYLRVSLEALSAQPLSRETAASFSSEDQYTHIPQRLHTPDSRKSTLNTMD